jgi:5-methylcytosine-specific restriction endonuclease McrA
MQDSVDYWAPRRCLLEPLPEHDAAARLLSEAADAILADDLELARDLVRQADMRALFEHADLVMNGKDPRIQRRRPVQPLGPVPRTSSRMPGAEGTKALFARDGWRCRFCECRVIPPTVRSVMRAALPGAIPWAEAEGYHGAFYALSASVDHIVPHSAGGTNDLENLVTVCWSCQFGRGAWSLEEVGLFDPRARPPRVDDWDGLMRLLTRPARRAVSAAVQTVVPETTPDARDVPPPMPKPSRLSESEWFASLDAIQPKPSSRLTSFVGGCTDLGVSWKLNDVLLVRMAVGDEILNVVGVQKDGSCQIPWSIGRAKAAFKGFAETLAAGIPGAIFYETPKMWVVSKPDKKRINLLELLEALPALRRGLEGLRVELLVGSKA